MFSLFLIGSLSMSFRTCETKPDILLWSKNIKLQRTDFVIVNSLPGRQLASISTSIWLNSNYQGTGAIRAYSGMTRSSSLFLKSINNEQKIKEILNHEQGHFNITEFVTRMLNDRLYRIKDWNTANKLFEAYSKDTLKLYQYRYDTQTNHHNDKVRQKQWDEILNKSLGISSQ